jgi:predicted ATPase/DNA-binding winged helix-turn-helix (wHTH) protein
MDQAPQSPTTFCFGRFQVVPHRREVLADGEPIDLGGRAFDVLLVLIEAHGAVVSKEALMARVWPNRVVEENALQAQISALRAALGLERGLIRTVSGRGYQFTGELRPQTTVPNKPGRPAAVRSTPRPATMPTNLPEPVTALIGRDHELRELVELATSHRLVTLTGPGGIGKTRLALAAGRALLPEFTDGVWLAEFSPLSDPSLVPATVAAAVRLELPAGEVSARRVAQALSERRLLLLLDTCEHVIDAATALAEAVLQNAPGVSIMTTSLEPLRAEGEQICAVPPLGVPTEGGDPWQSGAVQLFAARSRDSGAHVSEDRQVGLAIASICRQLDGIPLALELAAARAAALGITELATHLDDRFGLLTGGRRTALPRHQTLRAMLDWSHELLTEAERIILRRLAVFAGVFSLEAARTVVADTDVAAQDIEGVSNLVAKSLVSVEVEGGITRYRLLDTTRAYALEKLTEAGELNAAARRHAEYYRDLLTRDEGEWEARPTAEWLAVYGPKVDNLRAALDWAFSPSGDTSIGVGLAAAAVPLWMHLSLVEECRAQVEQALAAFEAGAIRDPRLEMKLQTALAASLVYLKGDVPEIREAWTKALQLAETLDDVDYQLRALRGLYFFHAASGRHRIALGLAQQFCDLAASQSDANDRLLGERLLCVSHHMLGDQVSARRHLEHTLNDALPQKSQIIRFQTDQLVFQHVFLSRILWLQGFPEQAMHAAEASIDDARATNHAMSLCYALALSACLIPFWVGDLATAERYVRMLVDCSKTYGLVLWHAFGRSYDGVLTIERGDLDSGLRLLRAGFDEFGKTRSSMRSPMFLGRMAKALGGAGRITDGLAAIDEALAWTEHTEERWLIADLLRVKAELLLMQDAPDAARTAEDHFRQALDWARRQGALSLELRAATGLARLLRDQERPADARALLQPVYDRFTEGFASADLKTARTLLAVLEQDGDSGDVRLS